MLSFNDRQNRQLQAAMIVCVQFSNQESKAQPLAPLPSLFEEINTILMRDSGSIIGCIANKAAK